MGHSRPMNSAKETKGISSIKKKEIPCRRGILIVVRGMILMTKCSVVMFNIEEHPLESSEHALE